MNILTMGPAYLKNTVGYCLVNHHNAKIGNKWHLTLTQILLVSMKEKFKFSTLKSRRRSCGKAGLKCSIESSPLVTTSDITLRPEISYCHSTFVVFTFACNAKFWTISTG